MKPPNVALNNLHDKPVEVPILNGNGQRPLWRVCCGIHIGHDVSTSSDSGCYNVPDLLITKAVSLEYMDSVQIAYPRGIELWHCRQFYYSVDFHGCKPDIIADMFWGMNPRRLAILSISLMVNYSHAGCPKLEQFLYVYARYHNLK